MTENPLSDDELLSSHLDGELTADERALLDERLSDDPDLRARLAAIEAAEALTSTAVDPLGPVDADRLIAAALAVSTAAGSSADNVTDFAAAKSQRRLWSPRIATIAAGVVALALTVPALRALDSGSDSDTAGVADSASTDDTADDTGSDGSLQDPDSPTLDMAAESAPVDMDSANDDMSADGATADDAVGDVPTADEARVYDSGILNLFDVNAFFDPLADELGGFDTMDALSTALGDDWIVYVDTLAISPTTTTADEFVEEPAVRPIEREEFLAAASRRLDSFATAPCDNIVDVLVDSFSGETILAADYATATVDGAPVIVGIFLRPTLTADLLVIDPVTCDVTQSPLG